MKRIFISLLILMLPICLMAQDSLRHEVLLETSKGNIRIALYNETPKHRDNFIKLVKEGFYDGVTFHRVIANFMIQTGNPTTKVVPGKDLDYTIPAEFHFPQLMHKRGAVAAARESDDVNPDRVSSACQFYIVWGRRHSDLMLDQAQSRLDAATGGTVKLTQEVREIYQKKGGTPHLDGQYTVFGEVLEGMDVVDSIQNVECDSTDKPIEDVRIIKATLIK